jgi:hypothetical protein
VVELILSSVALLVARLSTLRARVAPSNVAQPTVVAIAAQMYDLFCAAFFFCFCGAVG